MQQQHPGTEELPQVRGKLRRFPGVFGKVVAYNDPGGRPDVFPTPHD
jgi:hypothetical protein